MTWGSEWGSEWGGEHAYDFQAKAYARVWKQLEYATNLHTLLDIIAELMSGVDAELDAIASQVGIDSALGEELDDYGKRFGVQRIGASDELYKRVIKATVRKAIGEGEISTFYDVIDLFSPTAKLTIVEQFPAMILIWIHNLTTEEMRRVADILRGVPALGIGAQATIVDSQGVFEWGGDETTVTCGWSGDAAPSSESAGFAGSAIIQ